MLSQRTRETRQQSHDDSTKTGSRQIDCIFTEGFDIEAGQSSESPKHGISINTACTESPRNFIAQTGRKNPSPDGNTKIPSFEESIELRNEEEAIEIRNDQA